MESRYAREAIDFLAAMPAAVHIPTFPRRYSLQVDAKPDNMLRVQGKAMRALFSGSFDPVTNGHLDIIERVASVAESLLVAIARNVEKQPLLPEAERVALLRESCKAWDNVRVEAFQGLIVDAARDFGATVIVRGIRSPAELDRELQMAQVNRMLSGIETWLVPATAQWAFVSSSLVKELMRFGGDITSFVPAHVAARLRTRGMAG